MSARKPIRWNGAPEPPRKIWLRAGRCRVEVFTMVQLVSRGMVNLYSWATYDKDNNTGSTGQARTLAEAKRAGLIALMQQGELGWSGFHIGRRTLEQLRRFAALDALQGEP
jgi:hypothetical protein